MFDICDKIIALDPQYYPAYLLRQEACLYLGRYQEVINDYQRATALYPYHARPYCTLIRMYLSFGEQDRVKDILQLAKENGAKLIVLTSYPLSPLAKLADIILISTAEEVTWRSESLSSRLSQLCIMDALFVLIMFHDEDKANASLKKIRHAISYTREQ